VPVAVEETYSGQYIVVFDPLDGSSNLDAAVSTGSIWGIYEPTRTCIPAGTADDATIQARRGAAARGRASAPRRWITPAARAGPALPTSCD
jgi:fructose-1,6-bisphosphatase